jgi:aspartate/methionine/tyrosine aminotransferase
MERGEVADATSLFYANFVALSAKSNACMEIKKSGAALSKIVQIGGKLQKLTAQTGQEYLPLNRGINSVVNIDLREVVGNIDFNSNELQVYPPGAGFPALRRAINEEYFGGKSAPEHVLITAGGMNALDLVLQTLRVEKLYVPVYSWGSYFHIMTVRGVAGGEYFAQADLEGMIPELKGSAVLICDPGNPLGEKYDDEQQFTLVKKLSDAGVVVLFDSPYRRIFSGSEDTYYQRLLELPNVIITESFSKSVGLSGQRIGFIHATDKGLLDELEIRLMYCTNGINAFAQKVVLELLTSEVGRKAVADFKAATTRDIALNIKYLQERGLLAGEFYTSSTPRGIFVVVNKTEEELLADRIGSVSLAFFTKSRKEEAAKYARICVSMPHKRFVEFFDRVK